MKKIIVGSIQQESNSLTSVKSTIEDFSFFKGSDMLNKITPISFFEQKGFSIVPTIYAHALARGPLESNAFEILCSEMFSMFPTDLKEVAGVWLHLHGALEVDGIGSGDLEILRRVRERVGENLPVAVALDFHANISQEYEDVVNIVCGYRTAPHIDQKETEMRAARLLTQAIKKSTMPQTTVVKVPVIFSGDSFMTEIYPGKNIIAKIEELENEDPDITLSFFAGQPWVDAPYSGASVTATTFSDKETARIKAYSLGDFVWSVRDKFSFKSKTATPEEAIDLALSSKANTVFISDSGDNTTGGAVGDNAYFLKLLINKESQKVLVAGITAPLAIKQCVDLKSGDVRRFSIGGEIDSKSVSVETEGEFISRAKVPAWGFGEPISAALIRTDRTVRKGVTSCCIPKSASAPSLTAAGEASAKASNNKPWAWPRQPRN
jgi:microcystin degradation protein MlrC